MALFAKSYDRGRILQDAARARQRGRSRKAIELYRRVLEVEPNNPDLERRVAPLLARTRQREEAWLSYKKAADALAKRGFVDQAIGVYSEAKRYLPQEVELWRSLAELELERGRRPDALATLLEGRRRLRRRKQRKGAIALMERARRIDPRHFDTSFELACLLARDGVRLRAARLLEELGGWATGKQLRRVRRRQLRMWPSPGNLWRWLRSLAGMR